MSSYENILSELQEAKNNFNRQCESTSQKWDDDVKNRFYGNFVNDYGNKIEQFISKSKETANFLEIREKEMKSLVNMVK